MEVALTEKTLLALECFPLWSILIVVAFLGSVDFVTLNMLFRASDEFLSKAAFVRLAVAVYIICTVLGQFNSSNSCCLCCLVLVLC